MTGTPSQRTGSSIDLPVPGIPSGAGAALPTIAQRRKDTPSERAAQGKEARKRVPRSSHAVWEAAPDRPDPVDLLEEQAADRVQELVPIRYGRMLASPASFYRGGALLMASDLASTRRSRG